MKTPGRSDRLAAGYLDPLRIHPAVIGCEQACNHRACVVGQAVATAALIMLIFEAQLKPVKFGQKTEQLNAEHRALFDESVDADIAALEDQLEALMAAARKPAEPRTADKCTALPDSFSARSAIANPRITTCSCGCALQRIGEDVSEKLDYNQGVFTVERHVRGKWDCSHCRTLVQAPVPAEIIYKGTRRNFGLTLPAPSKPCVRSYPT